MNRNSQIAIIIIAICILAVVMVAALFSDSQTDLSNTNNTTSTPTPQPQTSNNSPTPNTSASASPIPRVTSNPTPTPAPAVNPTAKPTTAPTATPSPTPMPTPNTTPHPYPTPNPATVVFSDDFESEDTRAWTSVSRSDVNLRVIDGTLECSTNGPVSAQWGYVYKWLDRPYSSLNWRWYLYFGNLPQEKGSMVGAGGMYNSAIEANFTPANGICALNVIHQNGATYWKLDYANGNQVYSIISNETVLTNTWYLVELKAVQDAEYGEVHFYLNNIETLTATNLTNNNNEGIDHVSVGGGITADQAVSWFCTSAIASTEHIGPKHTTFEPNPATTAVSLTAVLVLASTYTANKFRNRLAQH